eukprot:PITA_19318
MQLDIAKAYDELNWNYIRKVLIAFGFDHNWVRWILALITSSSFSILVNGSPSETFTPSRGLRQGDPISTFLFILMMEGLGRAIKHAKVVGNIRGIQISDNGQALTHQQFVDDTLLQGIPTVKEALSYKQILNDFAMASVWAFKETLSPQNTWGSFDCKTVTQEHLGADDQDGDLPLFWEDRWQQEPILLQEDLKDLKAETNTKEFTQVKDFLDQTNSSGKWRKWRNFDLRNDNPLKSKAERLMKMLEKRKILVSKGNDQLRWGNNNEGNFNLKEAKLILLDLDSQAPDRIWQNLWKHQGWMKVKLFLWLVLQRRILTWDNIKKRGFLGPSRCQLCEAQEETTFFGLVTGEPTV